ncbi:hypothetical protein I5K02_27980 [Pseudomonas aeruginosa]|nr:hypothetical protein [Pseudomonas aeruginosa]HDZ3441791.1 hypothetical protein [Pseudomonas aeruginosa]
MLGKFLIATFCFALVQGAFAVNFVSTDSRYEPGGVRYFFTVTEWGGDFGFCKAPSNEIWKGCYIEIAALRKPGVNEGVIYGTYRWGPLKVNSSMDELYRQMSGFEIPFHGSIFVPSNIRPPIASTDELCIGFVSAISNGAYTAKGPCARVKAPALICSFSGADTIDHGNIKDSEVMGSSSEVTLGVSCSGGTSVTLTASETDSYGLRLRSDGSLYTRLTFNEKNASNGLVIPVQAGVESLVRVKSTLIKRGGVEPGAFSGSTIITISPP